MLAWFRRRGVEKKTGGDAVAETAKPVDRRNMLRLGGMAEAGAAGAVVMSAVDASSASAGTGTMLYGATNVAGATETDLNSSATNTLNVGARLREFPQDVEVAPPCRAVVRRQVLLLHREPRRAKSGHWGWVRTWASTSSCIALLAIGDIGWDRGRASGMGTRGGELGALGSHTWSRCVLVLPRRLL
jgi:hypothetical protein